MNKPTYLQGVILAESMYKDDRFTIEGLYQYLNDEAYLTREDYRWGCFWQGFHAGIGHIQRLKTLGIDVKEVQQ